MPAPPVIFRAAALPPKQLEALGPLQLLSGTWVGKGLNVMSLPDRTGAIFRVKFNTTEEQLTVTPIGGAIPNRGSVAPDSFLHGSTYFQRVSDGVTNEALHVEPGIWLNLTESDDNPVVSRLATVPHGDSILSMGTSTTLPGAPRIDPVDLTPFTLDPATGARKNETDPKYLAAFMAATAPGVPPAALLDPNSLLNALLQQLPSQGRKVTGTTALFVSAAAVGGINGTPLVLPNVPATPASGGTMNIPFVAANAGVGGVSAIFWIETIENPDGSNFLQLQYTQTVLLGFSGLLWPHVSVATMIKQ